MHLIFLFNFLLIGNSGELIVEIKDNFSKQPLEGVEVTIVHPHLKVVKRSTESGKLIFDNLPTNDFEIICTHNKYFTYHLKGIELQKDAHASHTLWLIPLKVPYTQYELEFIEGTIFRDLGTPIVSGPFLEPPILTRIIPIPFPPIDKNNDEPMNLKFSGIFRVDGQTIDGLQEVGTNYFELSGYKEEVMSILEQWQFMPASVFGKPSDARMTFECPTGI